MLIAVFDACVFLREVAMLKCDRSPLEHSFYFFASWFSERLVFFLISQVHACAYANMYIH